MENIQEIEWLNEAAPMDELNRRKLKRLSMGASVIDASMINPDLHPPALALDKLTEAIVKPQNHRYAVSRGVRRLREAFAGKYRSAFGVMLDPEREVCVSLGTKDAISIALNIISAKGSSSAGGGRRLLAGAPCYPMYRSAAKLAGMELSFFRIDRDEEITLESIRSELEKETAAAVLLNFPNNPTGAAAGPGFYRKLADIVPPDTIIINDFVYGEMHFRSRYAPSLLAEPSLAGRAVETYSLSKAYSVPGWRIGAISGASGIIQAVARLKSYVDYGAFLPLQMASTSLLNSSQDLVQNARNHYQARARLLVDGLKRMEWEAVLPEAGACVWARLPEKGRKHGSMKFAGDLLEQRDVVVMPGVLFGEDFDEYARFALVNSEERLQELLFRLGKFSYD